MDRRIHAVGVELECLLLATLGLSEWSAGRSAYPPTPDIEMGMSPFPAITTALERTPDVQREGRDGPTLTHKRHRVRQCACSISVA